MQKTYLVHLISLYHEVLHVFDYSKLYYEGKLTSYEEYLEAVMYRETLSPTGFERGLAIPHGKSKSV
ncbi:PTS sugar transporter subunit IIA, partial [Clostridioides difficile]|uniref:PTS sugar transporter subunit IIA n=1 Tax=Clostridioides difficile TaxID=1496 RepID=UPI002ED5FC77